MSHRKFAHFMLKLVCVLCCALSLRADTPTLAQAMTALCPSAEGLQVREAVIERDAFRLRLQAGTVYPLRVGDRVVGGVFLGKGQFELTPADETERRYLALRTGNRTLSVLKDTFERATLLFSDGAWEELCKAGTPVKGTDQSLAKSEYQAYLKREERFLGINLRLRILADWLEGTPQGKGLFSAAFKGQDLPPALAIFDPRGLASAGFDAHFGTETTALAALEDEPGAFWYSRTPKGELHPQAFVLPVEAFHYEIDNAFEGGTGLTATTRIHLKARQSGIRVIPMHLYSKLRIQKAILATPGGSVEVPFIQPPDDDAFWAAVVLPKSLGLEETAILSLTYAGRGVLIDAGGDNYYVGARTSWYPNLGAFTAPALFDLTYRVPNKNEVVSVGRLLSKTQEGKQRVFRFHTDLPVRVAGFNYGDFDTLERKDTETGITLRVHTNRKSPHLASYLMRVGAVTGSMGTEGFQENSLIDALNAARIGVSFFGPLQGGEISISQQPNLGFGQSWPSLIFLPYLAFMSSTHRAELGIMGAKDFADTVGYHELSHQWWGHRVGWATYRDQWLSEGFAQFSTGLAVQYVSGAEEYRRFLEVSRKHLLEKGRYAKVLNYEAGPLSLGLRLSSRQAPEGYHQVVYEKGAFVVHMLRSMLYDQKDKDPERRFKALLKDFASTWAGQSPTTEDFRAVVAKHAVGSSFGDMRWFFDQWIYGTELPVLKQSLQVKDLGGGVYQIKGQLSQTGVSAGFRSFVPLYVEVARNRFVRLGQVLLEGEGSIPLELRVKLDKAPIRAVANAFFDLLTKD